MDLAVEFFSLCRLLASSVVVSQIIVSHDYLAFSIARGTLKIPILASLCHLYIVTDWRLYHL